MGLIRGLVFAAGFAALAVAGYVVYRHWQTPGPEPLDPFRREAAQIVVDQIVDKIPTPDGINLVAMLPLAGDQGNDEVSRMLGEALNDSGRYKTIDPGTLAGWCKENDTTVSKLRTDGVLLRKALKDLDAEGVLSGRITSFPQPRGRSRTELRLKLLLADRDLSQKFEQPFEAVIEPGMFNITWWRAYLTATGSGLRFLVWILTVLILPLLCLPLLRKALTRESNLANLLLLLGLTAFDTIGAFFAMALRIDGFWDTLGFGIAFLTAAFWNYVAATFVEVYLK